MRKIRSLKVHSVVDIRTGKVTTARYLLSQMSEQEKHVLRSLQLGKNKILNYTCPACDQKIFLSGSGAAGKKTYHFKHYANLGDCPIKDDKNLSKEDLLKVMYNGAKESEQHKKLKNWLGSFLTSLENKGDFSNTQIEKRITSLTDRIHWRQPDVSTIYQGKRLVFELQLNGTFVEVIRGREQFYHDEKTFICWLFDDFDHKNTDFCERDIFWLNKSNAFVITNETMRLSEQKQDLFIECNYVNPIIEDNKVKDIWVRCIIPFSDLLLQEGYFKPFYVDSDSARDKLERQIFVPEFINYLLGPARKKFGYEERNVNDARFLRKFDDMRPDLNIPQEFSKEFINIVDALNFLKHGVTDAMFNSYTNIKQYTNQIIHNYSEFGYIYVMAVKKFRPDFKSEELSGKLKDKLEKFWKAYRAAVKEEKPDGQNRSYDAIIGYLFPELIEYLPSNQFPSSQH